MLLTDFNTFLGKPSENIKKFIINENKDPNISKPLTIETFDQFQRGFKTNWAKLGTLSKPFNLQYRYRNQYEHKYSEWKDYTLSSTTESIGDLSAERYNVQIRNKDDYTPWSEALSRSRYLRFLYTDPTNPPKLKISGNLMSLCYHNFENITTLSSNYQFTRAFYTNSISAVILYDASELRLPATTLTPYCYQRLFQSGYSSFYMSQLSAGPLELPAKTPQNCCYSYMFQVCKSLLKAPHICLSSLSQSCCYYMFTNCSSLSSIEVDFKEWNISQNATKNWLLNVSTTGEFICPKELDTETITRGPDTIPVGWTIIKK